MLGSLGSLGSLGLLGAVGLASHLAAAPLGAPARQAALQGVATPCSAKARLAFFSRSLRPMIGRWPRASR